MEAMPKQFARARRKGWEHRRGGSLSWRGEEAIGRGNTGNVEVEATARGRTWTEATETTHKRSQDRQPAALAAAIVIGGGDA